MTSKQIERCGVAYLAMWKLAAVVAMVAIAIGCKNDAITYAHAIAPDATCTAVNTNGFSSGHDTAVCRIGREIWSCASHNGDASCTRVDVPFDIHPLPTYVETPAVR